MINGIIRFAISQRLLVLFMVLLMLVAGVFSLQQLPIDAVPDITNVQVQILTPSPALAPLEVERLITFPIETAMSGLPGVTEIRSVSKFGLSAITVVFDDSFDTYFARQLVLERLTQVRGQIPESLGTPQMGPISTGLGEIYQYELRPSPGSVHDAMSLRTIQDWIVRRQLLGTHGIAEVNSYGGLDKQFQIRLDPVKLQAYGISLRDVMSAAIANNTNVGGAYIEHAGEQYILRGLGFARSEADIANMVVKTGKEGVPIFVRDIAEIVTAPAVRQGAVVADGKGEIVAGIVMMLKGENSRTVVERAKDRLANIAKTLPEGVQLVPFYDRAELVDRTIHTVEANLTEGAILVILVLILILGNWRGALLVASIIPLSMLFAAICMVTAKVSGNLMSLGALDFGLIVDGAVVMVENTVRRLSEHSDHPEVDRDTAVKQTILDACLEVGRPVVFAVAIITIVYLPILSLTGIEGKLFKPMSLTVVFALIGSLLLSLTYIPAAMTFVFKSKLSEKESPIIHFLKSWYQRALRFAMNHPIPKVVTAVILVLLSAVVFPFLGAEFIPRLDEGSLAVQIQQLPSVSLTQSIKTTTQAEQVLLSFPEVTKIVAKIGRAEIATDPMGVDQVDVYVALKPPSAWTSAATREELVTKMSEALEKQIPYAVFSFSQPIELRTSELIAGVRSDIAIKVFGEDMDTLKNVAEKIAAIVKDVPGATDIKVEQVAGLPQLIIRPDRAKIARYGLNVEDVNDLVETIVAGKAVGTIFQGERRFDFVVRLTEPASRDIETIKRLLLPVPKGIRIPLSEVAEIKTAEGPNQVSREDRQRRIVVELNVRGRDIAGFVRDAQRAIESRLKLPAGYYLTWGGQFENLQRASERLMIVVPIALFLIFILLFTTFGSVRQALLIYTGIPFAIVGGVFALALRHMPFSISAGVGFIALSGVAVLNGVVMVSYINSLRDQGKPLKEAVVEGAYTRFRPVLMTALVASLGFIPMAISTSAGAEVQRPLATVVIGGLITSSILTLLLLPTLYLWFEGIQDKKDTKG